MKKLYVVFFMVMGWRGMLCAQSFSQMYTKIVNCSDITENEYVWAEHSVTPFNELILSFNIRRPEQGVYNFYARIRSVGQWSAWVKTAEYCATRQGSFRYSDDMVNLDIDVLSLKKEALADAFEVKVELCDGATLQGLFKLTVCTCQKEKFEQDKLPCLLSSIEIEKVPLQSQMTLQHPRAKDMCSPTVTSTVVRYLLSKTLDPLQFAAKAHDDNIDIYGNWILNVAAVYDISQGKIQAHVEWLNNFAALHHSLEQGVPVVVSIQGPIKGSYVPNAYLSGHLIAVVGFDNQAQEVICMDSGFTGSKIRTRYALADFLQAWGRRKNLAYVFS